MVQYITQLRGDTIAGLIETDEVAETSSKQRLVPRVAPRRRPIPCHTLEARKIYNRRSLRMKIQVLHNKDGSPVEYSLCRLIMSRKKSFFCEIEVAWHASSQGALTIARTVFQHCG